MMDGSKLIRQLDRSDMLGHCAALPAQCVEGWRAGLEWPIPGKRRSFRNLIVLGMGGSAIGADLLQGLAGDRMPLPMIVNRTYTLPSWVGRETLVLASSYSGNTEETLSAAAEADRRKACVMAVTSGGKLAAWAGKKKFPLLRIPSGLPPRAAVGYMVFAPLGLYTRLGILKKGLFHVEKECAHLEKYIASVLAPSVPPHLNPAKKMAADLVGRLPILYGASDGWEGITFRWKTQLEENSKSLAFHHLFPEATHNEISGWVQPKVLMNKLTAVFLLDPAIHPRIQRRMTFTRGIVRQQGAKVLEASVSGGSLFLRKLKLVALGDFVSAYLALLYKIDPTPVIRVEALKKYMNKKS